MCSHYQQLAAKTYAKAMDCAIRSPLDLRQKTIYQKKAAHYYAQQSFFLDRIMDWTE